MGRRSTGDAFDTETAWLDYGARMYDPTIGRWGVVDPLSEKYYSFSPYVYSLNDPVLFNDFDGRDIDPSRLDKKGQEALLAFARTEVGYKFLSQFASKTSYKIAGVKIKFAQTGVRSKDQLIFRSEIIQLTQNTKGLTQTFLKNDPINLGLGMELREAYDASDKSRIENGVLEVITLDKGESTVSQIITLGHEAFVHAQGDVKDLKRLDRKVMDGSVKPGSPRYIEMVQNIYRGKLDHERLAAGSADLYKNYAAQLDKLYKTTIYTEQYNADVKNHKAKR